MYQKDWIKFSISKLLKKFALQFMKNSNLKSFSTPKMKTGFILNGL